MELEFQALRAAFQSRLTACISPFPLGPFSLVTGIW